MKKVILIFSSIFIFLGCTQPQQNPKLYGDWSRGYRENAIQFYKDSIVIREFGLTYSSDWTSDTTTIYFDLAKHPDTYPEMSNKINYKLNDASDTLYIKREDEPTYNHFFYRVSNAYDNILQRNEISLELPFAKGLEPSDKKRLAVNLLLGYRNDTIVFKFQDGENFNLKTLKSLSFNVFNRLNHKGSAENVQFNLIADKNISVISIDSIMRQLHTIGFENVFRVYANDRTDYNKTPWLSPISWYGYYK